MKKLLLVAATLFASLVSNAQFFEQVNYRGAFGSIDWTKRWTNWDPVNTTYSNAYTSTISSDITTNTTFSGVVKLLNKVYVTNNAQVTFLPGTVIRGDKNTQSTLIISRGSKIYAQGTIAQPIVFTSGFEAGSDGLGIPFRAVGDWGGLVILGKGVVNNATGTGVNASYPVIEGGLDPVKASFGGEASDDNSGVLKFVRIEFPGFPFQQDKEINGLTLGAVGSSTGIDFVQVSYSNDDSFEWFGGSVNAKHLIAYRGVDDDFDTDNGFNGNNQFLLAIRDPQLADQCTCSTSESFESDNDASGSTATPLTNAIFSNVTLIGPYRGSTSNVINAKFERAFRIRRRSSISVFNTVVTDWKSGLHYDGSASEANFTNGNAKFMGNLFAGNLNDARSGTTFSGAVLSDVANLNTLLGSTVNAATIYVNPYSFTTPDFALKANSPAAISALLSDAKFTGNTTTTLTDLSEFTVLGTNVKDGNSKNASVVLYPNPTEGDATLAIETLTPETISVLVYNITGTVLKSFTGKVDGFESYQISGLDKGLYFVSVKTGNTVKTVKLIVK